MSFRSITKVSMKIDPIKLRIHKYLNYNKNGKFLHASVELNDCEIVDGVIVDAKSLGWTITDNPINTTLGKAKIIA